MPGCAWEGHIGSFLPRQPQIVFIPRFERCGTGLALVIWTMIPKLLSKEIQSIAPQSWNVHADSFGIQRD